MAIIKCKKCRKSISNKVVYCPHCEYTLGSANQEHKIQEETDSFLVLRKPKGLFLWGTAILLGLTPSAVFFMMVIDNAYLFFLESARLSDIDEDVIIIGPMIVASLLPLFLTISFGRFVKHEEKNESLQLSNVLNYTRKKAFILLIQLSSIWVLIVILLGILEMKNLSDFSDLKYALLFPIVYIFIILYYLFLVFPLVTLFVYIFKTISLKAAHK